MTNHPEHRVTTQTAPGLPWAPAKPIHPTGLLGWQVRRACRRRGGHWWHPEGGMTDWFCCGCGTETSGMPTDGSAR